MINKSIDIKKLKKAELLKYIEQLLKKNNNQIYEIKNLKIHIEKKDEIIKKYKDMEFKYSPQNLNLIIGQRVFIEALTPKGLIRTYDGLVAKETTHHIKLMILTNRGNYHYIVNKSYIKGMKLYRLEDSKELLKELNYNNIKRKKKK